MNVIQKILQQMHDAPNSVRHGDLLKDGKAYFSVPRKSGGSHAVLKTPWQDDPRINIQNCVFHHIRTARWRSQRQSKACA